MTNNTCPPVAKIEPLLAHEYGDGAITEARKIRKIWKAELHDSDRWWHNVAEIMGGSIVDDYLRQFYHPPELQEIKRAMIDRILQTHGVEFLGIDRRSGRSVYYCNAGDTYSGTIVFIGDRLTVGCWGDLVERGRIHEVRPHDCDQ